MKPLFAHADGGFFFLATGSHKTIVSTEKIPSFVTEHNAASSPFTPLRILPKPPVL
jgi:hypothetical protein